jgi:hypothetical protein
MPPHLSQAAPLLRTDRAHARGVHDHRLLATYYFRFLTDLPPLTTLVQLHGAVFTAWLLVFVAQTRLVAARRVDLHE